MPRRVTLWYLTRDRHWLLKRPDKPFTQHFTEKLDFIVPWGRPIEAIAVFGDDYTDGPVSDRVAVVDVGVERSELRPAVRLVGTKADSRYDIDHRAIESEKRSDRLWTLLESDEFIATNCFATVMQTLEYCERLLGRAVEWATSSPQLLLVPRAGEMRNAFYERESGSIQFFHWVVTDDVGAERSVYTALSHDIIAHETTHAIVDGLLPDLYNASAPESLAIHESLADLVAITQNVRELAFEASERNIDRMQEFSEVAEEFGAAVRSDAEFLRSALNDRTLELSDTSVDPLGYPNLVDVTDPHLLSQVLTGAIYGAFARFFKGLKGQRFERLRVSAEYFPVIVIEALNYLPPGELSFVDVARATLVATEQSRQHAPQIFAGYFERGKGYGKPPLVPEHERDDAVRALCDRFDRLLRDEFVKRHVVDNKADLGVTPPELRVDKATRASIVTDPTAAAAFVRTQRDLFGIPDEIEPTVDVQFAIIKRLYCRSRQQILVRARWERSETIGSGGVTDSVVVPIGATMAIDNVSGWVLSVLRTHTSQRRTKYREAFLQEWGRRGVLVPETRAVGYDGEPLRDAIVVERSVAGSRLRGSAHVLHISGDR